MTREEFNNISGTIPHQPGCYRYYDEHGELLYVGKAKDLRKRVGSYFSKAVGNYKTSLLVMTIARIEYTVTNTEHDAFLLENSLIKRYQPRFNIDLKDDKTYPFIVIKKEPFPRVFVTRRVIKDGSEYLGPFTGVGMMENAMLRLDNYIQNLHDHYSIRRGELNITDIHFENTLKDVSDLYDITSKLKGVTFRKSVHQTDKFRSDDISIKIILNNLLSNAFKYQKKNKEDKFVSLDMRVENNVAIITVEDNGIGIPEKNRSDVFSMFFRGANDEIGSGFGLYNVKDALSKISGKIELQSVENEGTKFIVTIPSK